MNLFKRTIEPVESTINDMYISRENLEYRIDDMLKTNLDITDIATAMLTLENMSNKDSCKNDWESFCIETGYTFDKTLSTEAIISQKEGVTTMLTRFWQEMVDIKDDVTTVFNAFAGYDVDKLEKYLDMIKSGELVPRTELSRVSQEKLQDKLATFFVLGNSMKNGSSDLIEYMDKPVQDMLTGKYEGLFGKHFSTIFSMDPDSLKHDIQPYSTNLDISKIKMKLKLNDEQVGYIMLSFLVKRFYNKLYMYTLVRTDDLRAEDKNTVKHPFLNNIDILEIPSKYIEEIKPFSKAEIIKLLEYGIKANSDIKKAISLSKGLFLKYAAKNFISKTLSGLVPTFAPAYYIAVTRAFNVTITHIGNVSKDMIWYDKLILDIINAMYEKK